MCNLNQLEASLLKSLDIYGNITLTNLVINEFVKGRQEELTQQEKMIMDKIKLDYNIKKKPFLNWSYQKCNDLIVNVQFRGMKLTGKDFVEKMYTIYLGTDFGSCCCIVPHLVLSKEHIMNKTFEELWHGLEADALHGEDNGLEIVLDAELFNYGYHYSTSAGFKISLHHHSDKPMIQFSSQLILTGTETQINVKPTITYTTNDAISKFSPEDRLCYTDGEANLTYLAYWLGYRYEMNNCLIDEGIRDIIWNCRCIPKFIYDSAVAEYTAFIPHCTGRKLFCANKRAKYMGMQNIFEENDTIMPEAKTNPNMIGNISKPDSTNCMPACFVQENNNQMSYAPYPEKQHFFYQKTFCDVASHILQRNCQAYQNKHGIQNHRKFFIDKAQPDLCAVLENFAAQFGNQSTCNKWPENYFQDFDEPNVTLVDELYKYGKSNLAQIRVFIQSPYVTKIKRDVAVTFINYVANTGGLLGLCLGFSFISCIEIFFWFCCCFRELKK